MKFSVMHADFAASLDKLTAVVPAKPNLQVLSCVHLRLTEKTLVILANNLSLAVKVEIPARNDEPGEIFQTQQPNRRRSVAG